MRLLSRLKSLWANLVHRGRVEASLDDELRAYLDLLIADYERRGLSRNDAPRRRCRQRGPGDPGALDRRTRGFEDGLVTGFLVHK